MAGILDQLRARGATRHALGSGSVLTAHIGVSQGRLSTLSATPGGISAKLTALMANNGTALGAHLNPGGAGLLGALGGSTTGGLGGLLGQGGTGSGSSSSSSTATDASFASNAQRDYAAPNPPGSLTFK